MVILVYYSKANDKIEKKHKPIIETLFHMLNRNCVNLVKDLPTVL